MARIFGPVSAVSDSSDLLWHLPFGGVDVGGILWSALADFRYISPDDAHFPGIQRTLSEYSSGHGNPLDRGGARTGFLARSYR